VAAAFAWKFNKTWRVCGPKSVGDEAAFDVIRDHVKLTLQPADAPADPQALRDVIEQIGSDEMLLFSSDFPHWQFDGEDVLPNGLGDEQLRKILIDNRSPRIHD